MVENFEKTKESVTALLQNHLLCSPEILNEVCELCAQVGEGKHKYGDLLYINSDICKLLKCSTIPELNWQEFEKAKAEYEKNGEKKSYVEFLKYLEEPKSVLAPASVQIVTSHAEVSGKKEVRDFTVYFNARLEAMQKILTVRDELKGITAISRILTKKDRENISLIGLVKSKETTKNGNLILMLEDATGEIKVLINKSKPEIYDPAKDIVLDEVIGVSGVNGENIVFANSIVWPDVPVTKELKKAPEEAYALFLSDIHVGSHNFLSADFDRFLSWINQKSGNEKQKEIASKVKYIFIVGDLVDGVGVYPSQEEDLSIKDVVEQYRECKDLLAKIPQHIQLIICAGNHDALRIAEPQPAPTNEFCNVLMQLPNAVLVSNPAVVNICATEGFEGYNVLMYHGYSFDYYVANVDSIRNNGGYDRADLIMKFLLKRRHLAPTHTSTLYVPYGNKDPLVIDVIPDIFATGHIHKSSVSHYKNITLISGSCWQSKTAFQEKVGHHPEPSRVPIVNLASREVKVLRFGKE